MTISYMTEVEIDALQFSDLPRDTPFAIQGVSNTQLSIARHYGCCKFQGKNYTYMPPSDELIRDDVLRWLKWWRKPVKANPQASTQMEL